MLASHDSETYICHVFHGIRFKVNKDWASAEALFCELLSLTRPRKTMTARAAKHVSRAAKPVRTARCGSGATKKHRRPTGISPLSSSDACAFAACFDVGATGFEPATTWSQTRRATGLRYAPPQSELRARCLVPPSERRHRMMPCSTNIFLRICTPRSTCSSVCVAMRAKRTSVS